MNTSSAENVTISAADIDQYKIDIKEYIFPKGWTWLIISLHTVVFLIGFVGNILVCLAVYRNHCMRTITNYFIVNLAVADFLVIVWCLPPSVIWDVTSTWFLGNEMCKIVVYLQNVSVIVSVLTLTFISLERWYAICFPIEFKSTMGRAKTAIGIIWSFALLFDVPELLVYRTVPDETLPFKTIFFTQCEPNWSTRTDTIWTIIKIILFYVIPLVLMVATYFQIIKVLWTPKRGSHSTDITTRNSPTFAMRINALGSSRQICSRRKASRMLVAVVIMFAICFLPVHLLCVLRLTVGLTNSETNRAFSLISHWLCYANSAVNPVIYNFMSGKFRKEFRRAFACCFRNSSTARRLDSALTYRNAPTNEENVVLFSRLLHQTSKRHCIVNANVNDCNSRFCTSTV
ncbi:orexin receptor type 2-like [Agrilus planipennis]|uniref:Orexin receptor type 2-like n=1 Tax=Agrilus planipennis TaxID=224129 RepID=A0A1W4XMD0_AGRPL|nr:orexin receptor type 2-like [Agrilus planipennis]